MKGFDVSQRQWSKLLLFLLLLLGCCSGQQQLSEEETQQTTQPSAPLTEGRVTEVVTLVGGRARLPCDITQFGDTPILVLVYNGATGRPVYSIDSRSGSMESSVHWSALGDRAQFDVSSHSQSLIITHVQADDDGIYRCRVDFRSSPTRNTGVNLLVVVPPQRVTILNSEEVEVTGVIGPYSLGGSLVLTCQTTGGRPSPRVTWWHEGSLLDAISETNSSQVTRNTLTLPNLTRHHLFRVITCRASNSNLTQASHASVTIDMSFPPLDVRILGTNTALQEGQHYSFKCESNGSRPPATLSWWMDGVMMSAARDQVSVEANVSRTTLHLTPTRNNDGAIVSCRAENSALPGAAMEDFIKLTVFYEPQVELRTGHKLSLASIKEGDDAHLECIVQANPPPHTLTWFFQGEELHQNVSAGIVITNQSLVLQNVGRNFTGRYTCSAFNTRGSASSQPLNLNVKYPPVCAEDQRWTYGGGRGDQVNITCDVESQPEPHTFRWAFNTSSEMQYISKNRIHFARGRSVVAYTPITHQDFGTLLCWAVNEVGSQSQPCVYLVVPAAVPDPVNNCSVWHNASAAGEVVVSCEAGWSGGLTQTFTLEVRQISASGKLGEIVASFVQQTQPHFTVTGLAPGTEYQLAVGASNTQGAAPATLLLHHTPIDVAEKRMSAAAAESFGMGLNRMMIAGILAVVVGSVGSLVICSMVLVLVVRGRHRHVRGQPGAMYDKAAVTAGKTCDHGGSFEHLHRGPDLILVKTGNKEGEKQHPLPSVVPCGAPAAGTLTRDHQVGPSSTSSIINAGIHNLASTTATVSSSNLGGSGSNSTSNNSISPSINSQGQSASPSAANVTILSPPKGTVLSTLEHSATSGSGGLMSSSTDALINPSGAAIMNPSGAMMEGSNAAIIHSGEPLVSQRNRQMSLASPATLEDFHSRVTHPSSSPGAGRRPSFTSSSPTITTSSTMPRRRSSAVALPPDFLHHDLNTSRESCV
ncbi:protein turtle [Procambarus clarkii]|uniref:protein turtle n=1 Tax=Procambarus clarkii TaxID=6728 RepID=UPI003742B090